MQTSIQELLRYSDECYKQRQLEKIQEARKELAIRQEKGLPIPPPDLFTQYHNRVEALFSQLYDIAYELDCLCQAYQIEERLYDSDEWDLTPYKIEQYRERCQRMEEIQASHGQQNTD